jgi:hypothetical protein
MDSRTPHHKPLHSRHLSTERKHPTKLHQQHVSHDSSIRKGASIVRHQLEGSFLGDRIALNRSQGSDLSPTSILDVSDGHANHVCKDLTSIEKSWINWGKSDNLAESRNNSRVSCGVKLSSPSETRQKSGSSNGKETKAICLNHSSELSAFGAFEGLEVFDTNTSSFGIVTPDMNTNGKQIQRKSRLSPSNDSQPRSGNSRSESSFSTGIHSYSDSHDVQQLRSQDSGFPYDDNWESGAFEINEIQNNLYLLQTNDTENDKNHMSGSYLRNMDHRQSDDIYTITEESQSQQMSKASWRNPQPSMRSTRDRAMLAPQRDVASTQNQEDKKPKPRSFSFRSLRSSSKTLKSSCGSTRSDGYFSSSTISTEVDLGAVPSPLSYEYIMLLQDPAYRHAQKAGFLWQSIMGQHIRFPSSWWNGARAPPMGVSDVETCKWSYFAHHTIRSHPVLNQLHPGRSSPGKLLLHVLVQDSVTRQTVQDIAIGCFHPNARGVRQSSRAASSLEDSRDLWLAARKRNKGGVATMDRLLSRYSQWGESGYTKSPMGPQVRVSNNNVRAGTN